MNIKFSLTLERDSHNSNPVDSLEFQATDNLMFIKISGEDREIAVKLSEFRKLLKLIGE